MTATPRIVSRTTLALCLAGALAAGPSVALAAPLSDAPEGSSAGQGTKQSDKKSDSKSAKKSDSARGGAAGKGTGEGHNPPGNNGTIKIGRVPLDGSHGNQPHVGCTFALRFFGFDEDQTADISFTGQAPTKAGTLLEQKAVSISDDEAGGGKDTDEVLFYTAEQLGLLDVPQAKQGWHVKVAVDVLEAPGGAKHKVFWLSCPTEEVAPPAAGGGTEGGGTVDSGGGGSTVTPPTYGKGSLVKTPPATGTTVTPPTRPVAPTAGGSMTAVGSGAGTFGSGSVSVDSLSDTAATDAGAGSALPFTGAEIGTWVAASLLALGLGGAALYAGRRREV